MIRLALLAIAFVGITAGLLVFQPGSNRRAAAPEPLAETIVTRSEPSFTTAAEPVAPVPEVATNTAIVGLSQPVQVAPPASIDDESLRRMTWSTLSNLNQATGRESAPGQPGSLLHTIVRRSLDDQGSVAAAPAPAQGEGQVYIVQPGDSLVAIAERVYGDVNMTGPLFAANQAVLSRPDDLRPGLALVLPVR